MNDNIKKYKRIIGALLFSIIILLMSNYSALRKLDIATRGNINEPEYIEEPLFDIKYDNQAIRSSKAIVLVIDDFGYRNDSVSDGFLNLNVPITCAIIP